MADNHEVNDLLRVLDQFPGADLWGSFPCGPWSTWQNVNSAIHGKGYEWKLKQKRKHSMKILRNFLRCAETIIQNGGHVVFEFLRGCSGWGIPELVQFIKRHNLFVAEPDGCVFGLTDDDGQPHLRRWRVVTSSFHLARNLDAYKCQHPSGFVHSRLEGSKTPKSAFHRLPVCQCISNSLYPQVVPSIPVTPFEASPHVPREEAGQWQEFTCSSTARTGTNIKAGRQR